MLNVCEKKCDQCLFSQDRIVSKARMAEVLKQCSRTDRHFICHKTDDAVCRGFYDTQTSQGIRIAQRLDFIKFI